MADIYSVMTYNGRFGKNMQERQHLFDSRIEAEGFVKKTLKKRLNSKKRIGVNYAIVKPIQLRLQFKS